MCEVEIYMVTEVVLKCIFWDDVLCSFRKSKNVTLMHRCSSCSHYLRWETMMEEEDERLMDAIDREREELESHTGACGRVT